MAEKILLLGATGKIGTALRQRFAADHEIEMRNSTDFDAGDPAALDRLVESVRPDIVMNTVAFQGIDPCEFEPEKAFRINTLLPRRLAELSRDRGFRLVHFSTDAVFDDAKQDLHVESDAARPLNVYGVTKYGGDCQIASIAGRWYIARISVVFGETPKDNQFVEKMLARIAAGARELRIADDIVGSPTYSVDVAEQVHKLLREDRPAGVYHCANAGRGTLYELMRGVVDRLGLECVVEPGSFRDFPATGRKNTFTPLASEKLEPVRDWHTALDDYCQRLQKRGKVVNS